MAANAYLTPMRELWDKIFVAFDKDSNGFIDKEEVKSVEKYENVADLAQMMWSSDANYDEKISKEEWDDMFETMLKDFGAPNKHSFKMAELMYHNLISQQKLEETESKYSEMQKKLKKCEANLAAAKEQLVKERTRGHIEERSLDIRKSIGIQLTEINQCVFVSGVEEGTQADAANIKTGWRVLSIDDETITSRACVARVLLKHKEQDAMEELAKEKERAVREESEASAKEAEEAEHEHDEKTMKQQSEEIKEAEPEQAGEESGKKDADANNVNAESAGADEKEGGSGSVNENNREEAGKSESGSNNNTKNDDADAETSNNDTAAIAEKKEDGDASVAAKGPEIKKTEDDGEPEVELQKEEKEHNPRWIRMAFYVITPAK